MNDETHYRHIKTLAKETNTTPKAVIMVTNDIAQRLANKAAEVQRRAGNGGDENWLECYLACNAAPNPHARAIIEHKARVMYKNMMDMGGMPSAGTPSAPNT